MDWLEWEAMSLCVLEFQKTIEEGNSSYDIISSSRSISEPKHNAQLWRTFVFSNNVLKKKNKQFSKKLIKFSDSSGLESHAFRLFPHWFKQHGREVPLSKARENNLHKLSVQNFWVGRSNQDWNLKWEKREWEMQKSKDEWKGHASYCYGPWIRCNACKLWTYDNEFPSILWSLCNLNCSSRSSTRWYSHLQ